ncbi:MAG: lysylphosphatidylglycerol synthase domain-containing protein [Thermodesulfobacteriota bacterium]|nr:lysylphosphatidylglycerol synthase domain-containing protein [Thermodesulfobacteriota bacterium]
MEVIDSNIYKTLIQESDSDGAEITQATKKGRTRSWFIFLKKIMPWAAAVILLSYLFYYIDIKAFLTALLKADPGAYFFWLITFGITAFVLDVQNLRYLFLKFNYDVPLRKLFNIRGVSYLAMIVNYTIGIGSISLFLKRDAGIPLFRSASILLVYNSATQNCLAFLTAVGFLFYQVPSTIADSVFIISISIFSVSIVIISVLKYLNGNGKLDRFTALEIVKVFYELPWKSYILITFWRCIYYLSFLVFFYFAVRAFNMDIPIAAIVVYVPMILLIISLPVAPFGLGTSQGAMILFFKDYGSESTIFAFSIAYSTSIIIVRGLIGLLFLSNIPEWFLNIKTTKGE